MAKVWDCISFFCEKDLLQLRIEHLQDHVDYFVIAEADKTHQGEFKEFILPKLLENELSWAAHKIIPVLINIDINNLPLTIYSHSESSQAQKIGETHDGISWRIENFQRNSVNSTILELADQEDIILIGDLDEIPSLHIFDLFESILNYTHFFTIVMKQFQYYLDVSSYNEFTTFRKKVWAGTVVTKRKYFKSAQICRDNRQLYPCSLELTEERDKIPGFHFSWLYKWMPQKYCATAHDEIQRNISLEDIFDRVSRLEPMFQDSEIKIDIIDIDKIQDYPQAFKKSIDRFPELYNLSRVDLAR